MFFFSWVFFFLNEFYRYGCYRPQLFHRYFVILIFTLFPSSWKQKKRYFFTAHYTQALRHKPGSSISFILGSAKDWFTRRWSSLLLGIYIIDPNSVKNRAANRENSNKSRDKFTSFFEEYERWFRKKFRDESVVMKFEIVCGMTIISQEYSHDESTWWFPLRKENVRVYAYTNLDNTVAWNKENFTTRRSKKKKLLIAT